MCFESLRDKTSPISHSLVALKNRGGLVFASEDVIKVCMWSEAKIRQFISKNGLFPCNIKSLNIFTSAILKMLLHYPRFESLKEHSKEQNVQDNHMFYLVRLISNTYLNIRMHYTTKMKTEKLHDVKVRQHLLKTTLFKGQ